MLPKRKKNILQSISNERRERIYTFLLQNNVGSLATVDSKDDPDVAVIYYFPQADFTINFMTKTGTKKSDNISHNSHVKLLVYEAKTNTTATITGIAEQIDDVAMAGKVFSDVLRAAWQTSDDGVPPISRLLAGEYVAYKIVPKQVQMAVYVRPEYGSHAELFETLEAHDLKP